MDRMAILLLILGLLAGCRGQTPTIDPFATYGPSRIAPPSTGSARRTDPYYRGSLSSSTAGGSSTQGIAAQGLPTLSRFTSEDPGSGAVEVADQRAADTSPSTGNGPSGPSRRLDWRSPTTGAQSYAPSADAQSPRPRFPSTPTPSPGGVGLPNVPLVQQGPVATPPNASPSAAPGSVYPPNGQVAPAGSQPTAVGQSLGEARY
jgi:hypothetical protein